MTHLPIEFADWQTPCTPQADKAPAAVGPLVGAGLGCAASFRLTVVLSDDESFQFIGSSVDELRPAMLAMRKGEYALFEVLP